MDKIVIKACLNGIRGREVNPQVPWTPAEVAAEARRAEEAGAAIVHIHARTPQGGVSYDPAWYSETDQLIRAQTKLIVNHTTARTSEASLEQVLRYLQETPEPVDMISLNLGYIVFFAGPAAEGSKRTVLIPNSYNDIRRILAVCYERGIFPEPALLDTGFLNNAATLAKDGLLRSPHYFLVEFGGRFGGGLQIMPGTPASYFYLTSCLKEVFPGAVWIAHGIEESVFTIASLAITTGAHVRVGLEDTVVLPDGKVATSNAELVEWAALLARAHGREPATPEEAREILRLN
jgi:3-keto-5-aminohexanoate cleavage enzyme